MAIKEQFASYIHWCKVNNLAPNIISSLNKYCDICLGDHKDDYAYKKYVLKQA